MKYYNNIEILFRDINKLENETIMVHYNFEKSLNNISIPEYKYLRKKIKEKNIKIVIEPKENTKDKLYKLKTILGYYNKEEENGKKII